MKSVFCLSGALVLLLTWLLVVGPDAEPAFHVVMALDIMILASLGIYFEVTE